MRLDALPDQPRNDGVHETIELPEGTILHVPEDMTVRERLDQHIFEKLSEHVCPYHLVEMEQLSYDSSITPGTGVPYYTHLGCRLVWQLQVDGESKTWVAQDALAYGGVPVSMRWW